MNKEVIGFKLIDQDLVKVQLMHMLKPKEDKTLIREKKSVRLQVYKTKTCPCNKQSFFFSFKI